MQRTGGLGYAASPLPPAEGQGEGASFGVGSQVATVSMRLKPSTVRTSVPGDLVYCVSDADGEGPIDVRPVEQVYHNAPARLLNIHMGDEIIRATPNHPFYVRHRGWTAAALLERSDELRSFGDAWLPITETFDNGDIELVFNLRVAGHHAYFAGTPTASCFVLVHNESPKASFWDYFDANKNGLNAALKRGEEWVWGKLMEGGGAVKDLRLEERSSLIPTAADFQLPSPYSDAADLLARSGAAQRPGSFASAAASSVRPRSTDSCCGGSRCSLPNRTR